MSWGDQLLKGALIFKKIFAFSAAGLLVLTGCSSDDEGNGDAIDLPTLGEIIEMEREIWTEAEQFTAACMDDLGMEYEVRDFPDEDLFVPLGQPADLSGIPFEISFPVEEAEENAFGVYQSLEDQVNEEGAYEDPNDDLLDDMSEDEVNEWQLALIGNPDEGILGCRSSAEEEARMAQGNEAAEIDEIFQFMQQAISSDPRIEEVWGEWSSCMAEEDYEAESIEVLVGEFDQEAEELYNEAEEAGDNVTDEQLADFRDKETAAAVASAECFKLVEDDYAEIVEDARDTATSPDRHQEPNMEDFMN